MKSVLLIAYHFPPLAGSSGIQRTLRFAQHLPDFGWRPLVLTTHPRAYARTAPDLLGEIPAHLQVYRTAALDTARHLSVFGYYPRVFATPDRWVSWLPSAVLAGLAIIRSQRIKVLWSTYPIASAHLVAAVLHKISGLPWIADFRDPMAQLGYPHDTRLHASLLRLEAYAAAQSRYCTFTTPGAVRVYGDYYPQSRERMVLLENGYDEGSFVAMEAADLDYRPLNPGAITLLHSGVVYPGERDPAALFAALGQLLQSSRLRPGEFKLRFRAPEHFGLLRQLAAHHGVESIVDICRPIGYREALKEMLSSDALLVMQGAVSNNQIPAKVYEYLRAQRPIVCLTDPTGDTAAVMGDAGVTSFARLDAADEIAAMLPDFIARVRSGVEPCPHAAAVRAGSRRRRTQALAELLEIARFG